MDYDAELRNWSRYGTAIVGLVYNDAKHRFVDGEFIRTSTVLSIELTEDGNIAQTLNSRYKLVD